MVENQKNQRRGQTNKNMGNKEKNKEGNMVNEVEVIGSVSHPPEASDIQRLKPQANLLERVFYLLIVVHNSDEKAIYMSFDLTKLLPAALSKGLIVPNELITCFNEQILRYLVGH